jgi:2-polyprenyl-3-methyl-5-hydroxy-6-metoxy-1,4-benzoquinol methylase
MDRRAIYERAYTTGGWQRRGPGHEPSRFAKVWYRALLDHVLPLVPVDGRHVLDVGAGYGYLVPHLEVRVARYIGVDLALSAVRQFPASSTRRAHGLVANGTALPFPAHAFDLALCLEVIEHVAEPAQLVEECFRVVRPGGHVVFSTPNYSNLFILPTLLADLGLPAARRYMNRPPLPRTTTAPALRRLLARRGRIVLQRGARMHPPLFERLDAVPLRGSLGRLNDWLWRAEDRWGHRMPLRWMGLHTIIMAERLADH